MQFKNVCLEAIGVCLPEEIWTSQAIETRLAPLYERLRLPEGRLALMSGIEQRRVWPTGMVPSGPSMQSGQAAIAAAGIKRSDIGCLIHASVCRDFLEPATAARVHDGLGLSSRCWVYDVSNACLGLLNGTIQIASLIEAGVIEAGLVVGTENGRPLLEQTIAHLNRDPGLTRKSIKPAFASLTIGSGSCAFLLTHRSRSHGGSPLMSAVAEARTEFHGLCRSDDDSAGAGMLPLMETDSERLLREGVATGAAAFQSFLQSTGWRRDQIDATICHQVGGRHRAAMLEALGVPIERDFVTYPWLGNTGSVALPLTLASAAQWGRLQPGTRVGMFGIGSGINSIMIGCQWQETRVSGNLPACEPVVDSLVEATA